MDTDFYETQKRYLESFHNTPECINTTLEGLDKKQKAAFDKLYSEANRIICTGTGSSMPTAHFMAYSLQQAGKPAWFSPTGEILGMNSLCKTDLVILCSQGLNRADAKLIVQKTRSSDAKLVILTANRKSDYLYQANLVLFFNPSEEKLFCRPSGVAANIALSMKLFSNIQNKSLVEAWSAGSSINDLALDNDVKYVVLASDALMPAAINANLAIREGAGIQSSIYDVETYAHGNYVADVSRATEVAYLLISDNSSSQASASIRRIEPFIKASNIKTLRLTSPYNATALSIMYVLGAISKMVYKSNASTLYNMNRPPGKEENRYYHELESAKL